MCWHQVYSFIFFPVILFNCPLQPNSKLLMCWFRIIVHLFREHFALFSQFCKSDFKQQNWLWGLGTIRDYLDDSQHQFLWIVMYFQMEQMFFVLKYNNMWLKIDKSVHDYVNKCMFSGIYILLFLLVLILKGNFKIKKNQPAFF